MHESSTEQDASLFRQEAMDHYLRGNPVGSVLRVTPPWTRRLFWLAAAITLTAVAVATFGKVEITSRGRGILRPTMGLRQLTTQSAGVVSEVFAPSGRFVRKGAPVIRLASATLRSELMEAERKLTLLETALREFAGHQGTYSQGQVHAIRSRIALLTAQIESIDGLIRTEEQQYAAEIELARGGLLSQAALNTRKEAVESVRRQRKQVEEALSQARQEESALRFGLAKDLAAREEELRIATARRDAVRLSLEQMTVVAPVDGHLEAVLVRPGDVLPAGTVVGKLIPRNPELHAVSFLAERDRAFLRAGDSVRIELEQLPFVEFGSIEGTIVRISDDLASPYEVREALGEDARLDGPAFRVEIAPSRKLPPAIRLRPGMLLTVRYTLRRQRLISLVIDPLHRWLE